MIVKTLEKEPLTLKVWQADAMKYFEVGESVRVIAGIHSGGAGIVVALSDKHAVVAMEGTKSELKIMLSNLKAKKEQTEDVRLEDYISKT